VASNHIKKKKKEREAPATPRNCETIKLDLNIEKRFCKEKKKTLSSRPS